MQLLIVCFFLGLIAAEPDRCDEGSLLQLIPDAAGIPRNSALENLSKEVNTSERDLLRDPGGTPLHGATQIIADTFRTWFDWVKEGIRSQEGISSREHLASLQISQAPVQEHQPVALKWMTVTLGGVIGVALLWAAWHTFLPREEEEEEKTCEVVDETDGVRGMNEIQLMFNIVKSVVGEGMLSLPASIASGTGLLAGFVMTIGFAGLLAYTFSIMGRVCHVTGERSHKDCCAKVADPWLARSMAAVLFVKTGFSCLVFAIVISESLARILRFSGVHGFMASSQVAMLLATIFVLIPLCMQKELRILSYTSAIGCLGQVWAVLAMQIRYLDGSYVPGGQFYNTVVEQDRPHFADGVVYWKTSAASFVLLASLNSAYIGHYNAPKFYAQLQDATPEKFRKVVYGAFGFAMVVYLWIMSVGYLTFGTAAEGLILNNYSDKDSLMTTARFSVSVAVIFVFPLGFTGLRDSTMSTFDIPQARFKSVTFGLLGVVLVATCLFHDLGLANQLGGAVMGAMITLIFPALLMYYAGKQPAYEGEFGETERRWGAWAVLFAGSLLILFGTTIVLLKEFRPEVLNLS